MYTFEVFVTFASCARNVPGVECGEAEDKCAFTKFDGIVPTWYQFSAGVHDVVLDEFIMFGVEFVWLVVGEKFRAVVATECYFLGCRPISIHILIWIKELYTFFVVLYFFLFRSSFFLFGTDCLFL